MKKKIIVHLQLLPILSGVQNVTLDEIKSIDADRYCIYVVCKEKGGLTDELDRLNVRYFLIKSLNRNISISKDILAFVKLLLLLKQLKPDILHTHSSKTGILGRLVAFVLRIPVIHTVHGFPFDSTDSKILKYFYYLLESMCCKLSKYLIVLNSSDLKIANEMVGNSNCEIKLIPNGVDLSIYPKRLDSRQKNILKKELLKITVVDSVVVGMVGRLWPQKNPLLLLKSFINLYNNYPELNLYLYFVGDGELHESIDKLIKINKLENRIILMGWRTDIIYVLQSIDIFVLPSLWEGLPLSILEAMSSHLPIIASDIPGNRDLVKNGINGLLFKSNDSSSLFNALEFLVLNETKRDEFGTNSYQIIRNKFKLSQRVSRIQNIYDLL